MGKFTVDLTAIINKAKARMATVVKKIEVDLFTAITLKSPVDTGRFRANWNASIGGYGTQTVEATDLTGRGTISRMVGVVNSSKLGDKVFFTNSLPYSVRLEYGYSDQAPSGMVRITVVEFQNIVKRAAGSV